MPKNRKLDEDSAEMGRFIGSLERIGYKDLMDEVRAMAKAEGKTVTDKLAEVIKVGISYEKYKDLTLADAMKVMDFIERAFNNFLYPVMYMTGQFGLETSLERIRTLAQAMGWVPREYAERRAEEKAMEMIEQVRKEAEEKAMAQAQGPFSKFIDKISEVLAERIGGEVIQRLVESGKLDEFLDMLGETALKGAESLLRGGAKE